MTFDYWIVSSCIFRSDYLTPAIISCRDYALPCLTEFIMSSRMDVTCVKAQSTFVMLRPIMLKQFLIKCCKTVLVVPSSFWLLL